MDFGNIEEMQELDGTVHIELRGNDAAIVFREEGLQVVVPSGPTRAALNDDELAYQILPVHLQAFVEATWAGSEYSGDEANQNDMKAAFDSLVTCQSSLALSPNALSLRKMLLEWASKNVDPKGQA